jgi:predicted amidohydrolase YtcJ
VQVAIHAIGDKAVDDVASLYTRLPTLASQSRQRSVGGECAKVGSCAVGDLNRGVVRRGHRVEHVQHISGESTARALADAGTWAVVNPLHLPLDMPNLVPRLGAERAGAGRSYAFNTLDKVRHHEVLT